MIPFQFFSPSSSLAAALVILFLAASCKNPEPDPVRIPVEKDVHDNPDKPELSLFGHVRVQWTQTDYREVFYNKGTGPVKALRENLFIENSNVTKKIAYDFLYNEAGLLVQVKEDNGVYVNYRYEEGAIAETKQFAPNKSLLVTRKYYYGGNQLNRLVETDHGSATETEYKYFYDDRQNLTEIRQSQKNPANDQFETYSLTRFSEYDNQRNVENIWMIYPFLPSVSFGNNNFGKVSYFYFDGKNLLPTSPARFYTREYDKNGFPVSRKETTAGGTLNASYTYAGF